MVPSLVTTNLQRIDSAQEKSWDGRVRKFPAPDKHQSDPAIGFIGSPKHIREEDKARLSSQTLSRPRLKLNPPKPLSSQQQNLIPVAYTSGTTRNVRSPHRYKLGMGSEKGRQRASLSRETQQAHSAESDSDDATVRMLRSINQASAMYNKEPQVNAGPQERICLDEGNQNNLQELEKEDTPTDPPLKLAPDLGSPELGERLSTAPDTNDIDMVSKTLTQTEKDAADLAVQPEEVSTSENVPQSPDSQRSSSIALPLAAEKSATHTALDERQQSTTGQESLLRGCGTSYERGEITPEIELLESIFKPLVEEMRAGQEYLMAGFLSRARMDAIELSGPKIDQSLPDPFAAGVANISTTKSSKFDPLRRVQMESRVVNARNKAPPLVESQAVPFESEAQRLPKYNSIVRLGSNILAPNDKDLRYLPYFPSEEEMDGSDAADHKRREELLEGFDNRIKFLPEKRKCAEQADFWREHVDYFLEEVGCTCVDVMFYLLHDEDAEWKPECQLSEEALSQWQEREVCCSACGTKFEGDHWDRLSETLSKHKPEEKPLAIAGLICSVFNKIAKFSIWHIASTDAEVRCLLRETETKPATEQKPEGPEPQSLCMLCHVFDCPTHGAYLDDDSNSISINGSSPQQEDYQDSSSESSDEVEAEVRHDLRQTVALPERPRSDGQQHRCGFFCLDPYTSLVDTLGLHKNGEVKGSSSMKTRESGDAGFADEETCSESCFWDISNRAERTIADLIRTDPIKRFVDWSGRDIKLYKSMLATCVQFRRGPCIMAITLARPCSVIFEEILLDIHAIPHAALENETNEAQPLLTALTNGYKDKHYWSESSQTYDHHKRYPFMPCSHSGPCHKNADCTCWANKVACEWICGCDRACSRRFQGCRCIARGAKVCFKDPNCDCWVLNRECDPWLCGKCGVLEVLDPVNRHADSILKGRCKNAMIQRNVPKRTLKGPSEVHGWGLFAGTDIHANEYIGEYKGEVISEEESNRRGLVYHYRGIEYLFRLNKEQEIDSSRAGNKMRFINNSERPSTINVYPQPMLCNGVQRIGLFAKRNIVAGEEMFFRYGYPESVTKHFWEKEDLDARRRLTSDDDLDDCTGSKTERRKGNGVKAAVVATKEKNKTRKGIGRQLKKALPKSGGNSKDRHAHFLDDIADDEPETSTQPQLTSHQLHRPKKRKRNSSPVIDETTFDLPQDEPTDEAIVSDLDAPLGPSSSSFSTRAEVAESDSDDEEYDDEEDSPADDDDDSVASRIESAVSDEDVIDQAIHPSTSRSTMHKQSSRRSQQTAVARAISLQNRRRAKAIKSSISTDINMRPIPTAAAAAAAAAASEASTPRRNRRNRSKKTSRSTDSDPVLPYSGKKRGRPFGWKKGIHFGLK